MQTLDYFITGGAGFIGTNLTQSLEGSYLVGDIVHKSPDHLHLDITHECPPMPSTTLVHLASETNVRLSMRHPISTIEKNIQGILTCLEHVRHEGASTLIFTSSLNSSTPSSPYLASKASCEAICQAYKTSYNLDIKVLNLSNVYGPHSMSKDSVIARYIKNCLKHLPLTIFGDGNQMRDFIYVGDVVKAIKGGHSGPVSSGTLTTISDLAHQISRISEFLIHWTPPIYYSSSFAGEVYESLSVPAPFQATPLDEGLFLTFNWFMENYPC